jgi:hypothetical protein
MFVVLSLEVEMKALALTLLLFPSAALADFDCTIVQQCGGGTCEPFTAGPMAVREMGDTWQVEIDGTIYEGYSTTTMDVGGEVSIVLPPQLGMSGLISIYPSGDVSFTAHAFSDGVFSITGTGTCVGAGG